MAGILGNITTGSRQEGVRVVIAANEKTGKTTLTAGSPDPLLVPLEIGYGGISIAKTPMLQTYNHTMQLVDEILQQCQQKTFPYRSIIFDSVTALERQIHTHILSQDPSYATVSKKTVTMESVLGGYGRGHALSNTIFSEFLDKCDQLAVYYGINIIFTSHVFAAKLVDPNSGEYDSWDILLHSPKNQKTYGKREILTQWADIIGFMYEPMYVTKGDNMSQGVSANKGRVLGLSRTPSYIAGNRFGVEGEIPIPKVDGWNHLAGAVYNSCGVDIYKR